MQALHTHSHASAPHMSPHLGRLAGMMGEVPSRCGRTEGKRERRREILVRTVSRWPSRFPWYLNFPDWKRRSSLRAAGCGDKLSGRHGCHSTEKHRGGQHPRPLPRNQDAIPAASSLGQEVPARRAHVDAAGVAAPPHALLPPP